MSPRSGILLLFLLIEFLDEFAYGAREAAWPLIRTDLALTYAQIGVLLGLPRIISGLVEPFFGILGDTWRRRALILGGGVAFALALLMTSLSRSYGWLLVSFIVLSPASGAFVGLSQASLMDLSPSQREKNMARWTFAGALGVVLGPLALGLIVGLGLGWRVIFAASAGLTMVILAMGRRSRLAPVVAHHEPHASILDGLKEAAMAVRQGEVLRWLVLLQFADLMMDVLLGFLALYFVDVAGVPAPRASTAVAVWTGVGLLGDFLLIRLLDRVEGLDYLRISAMAELGLFVALLLVRPFAAKLALLALLGLFNAGWYSILKARLYATMPGRSGAVLAVENIFGLAGGLLPWGIGIIAHRVGLPVAMWMLCLGPLALLIGIPRRTDVS
jgi:MFS transporter, FSR family, fosmidomycin resistance protein